MGEVGEGKSMGGDGGANACCTRCILAYMLAG